jgi:Flp pilus assembly pilin Flp
MRQAHEDVSAAPPSGEAGQTLVEYALVVTVISIGSIGALAVLTNQIAGVFQTVGAYL